MRAITKAELEAMGKRLQRSLDRAEAKITTLNKSLERAKTKNRTLGNALRAASASIGNHEKSVAEGHERENATAEILSIISRSPTDTQPVFDAIVRSGVRLFRGMTMSLRVVKGDYAILAASSTPESAGTGYAVPVPLADLKLNTSPLVSG